MKEDVELTADGSCAGPVTLADLHHDGKLLWLYCNDCCREIEVQPLSIGLPPVTPVPDVADRLKCSQCGSRKVSAKPELFPGGILAARARSGG